MRIGDLDRRITFQRRVGTQNAASGAWSYSWTDHATVRAQVQDYLRAESVEADIALAARPARIRIRWRADITSDMRVIFGDRTMRIVSGPIEIGRREWLQLVTAEFSTEGGEP